ncbi:hypothetical protein EV421DRAFT_2033950 [Armillaria borealis]|uniref:HIT-type domain-containing protein n=1 Tax=Armillaria borealis TaxID=47425 RepID=A0AA39JSZ8_9AGAR|nr:hypothetical protein EV421DRAFT_2033950 [Armillaria borealis]
MTENSDDHVVCKICCRQVSKYTCPTCNLPYCSLTCFRSPAHANCSETFYKNEIQRDVGANPNLKAEERLKMMEMLKRFEEMENEEDDNDDEDDGLAERFEGIDLDNTDELWSRLTPAERTKFLNAVADPSSELAQSLLASEEFDPSPWWETNVEPDIPMLEVPTTLHPRVSRALMYNLCGVTMAYAYTTRHLSLADPGAKELITNLVPFLADPRSTSAHASLGEAVTAVCSRASIDPQALKVLLKDTTVLLKPRIVMEDGAHPSHLALIILSDLAKLFARGKVVKKLVFYAACIMEGRGLLAIVVKEMEEMLDAEADQNLLQPSTLTDIRAERTVSASIEEIG